MKKNIKNSFENSIKQLEEIVEKIESGGANLEESISLYEKGIELKKFCEKRLKEAELKIKKIKSEEGKIVKKDFEDSNE